MLPPMLEAMPADIIRVREKSTNYLVSYLIVFGRFLGGPNFGYCITFEEII